MITSTIRSNDCGPPRAPRQAMGAVCARGRPGCLPQVPVTQEPRASAPATTRAQDRLGLPRHRASRDPKLSRTTFRFRSSSTLAPRTPRRVWSGIVIAQVAEANDVTRLRSARSRQRDTSPNPDRPAPGSCAWPPASPAFLPASAGFACGPRGLPRGSEESTSMVAKKSRVSTTPYH